jgi:hypothetical protein
MFESKARAYPSEAPFGYSILNAIMMSVIKFNANMLSVIMLNAIMLNVEAPAYSHCGDEIPIFRLFCLEQKPD